ncbi:unnamed protein product [Moneuplotes crassus]|uniref:Uncharacterized protein n=1 Tax=Euplotes crassus TaxID=5936 RepID=A0AAD1XKW1_EUPCR|nr:unnamed protein product [Moneuplotes crassus]
MPIKPTAALVNDRLSLNQEGIRQGPILLENKCFTNNSGLNLSGSAFAKYSNENTNVAKVVKTKTPKESNDSSPVTKTSGDAEELKDELCDRSTSNCGLYKPFEGKFTLRKDVVYKNLFRAIRATVWDDFVNIMPHEKYSRGRSGCTLFQQKVMEFYLKHTNYKEVVTKIFHESAGGEVAFVEILASFMTSRIFFKTKSVQTRKIAKDIKVIVKNYKSNLMMKIMKHERLWLFFQVLDESGKALEIIRSRNAWMTDENRKKAVEDRYMEGIRTIANYGRDRQLLSN